MALFVPIAIDAIYLNQDLAVPGPMMDFSKTPWTDGSRDYNNDSPYLSQTLYRKPFEDEQHFLKKGLHLHWALPDALTRSIQTEEGTQFPQVPNRWLVVRFKNGAVDKQWQVESDYLFPPGEGEYSGAITMPYQGDEREQPYRYAGRKYPLSASINSLDGETYLPKLTAIGWGEPTFAAYYPNCSSVFGFYDKEILFTPDQSISYQLIGYYSNRENDLYHKFIQQYRDENPQADSSSYYDALLKAFNWQVSNNTTAYPQDDSVYIAKLTFSNGANTTLSSRVAEAEVTVANKGTEALSAYLSQKIDSENASLIEEQLESLQMTGQLSAMQLDVLANFKENRHTNGFSAINSGTSWNIDVKVDTDNKSDAEASQKASNVELPPELIQLQVRANSLQYKYDKATFDLQSMQKQLFADWHKYMAASYPPNGLKEVFPPIDLIKLFLSEKEIKNLESHQERTGAGLLSLNLNDAGNLVTAEVVDKRYHGFAGQAAYALNELIEAATDFNTTVTAVENKMTVAISGVAAPRFWVANEPVVCLTGPDVVATDRHATDGELLCYNDNQFTSNNLINQQNGINSVSLQLIDEIDGFFQNYDSESIGNNQWNEQPWNPFILEWRASVFPLENKSNAGNANRKYSTDFISANYSLDENEPDFKLSAENKVVNSPDIYKGTTVLTPYAGKTMNMVFANALNESVMPSYFEANQLSYKPDYITNEENIDLVKSWYETTFFEAGASTSDKVKDPVYSILCAYSININLPSLSQSLGGFNNSLIQLEQIPQMNVAEPIGFESGKAFSEQVNALTGKQKALAPMSLNEFNPIRSGKMNVLNLRLIDSFGQLKDIPVNELYRTELLNDESLDNKQVNLSPRIVQPARINFRFLDASTDEEEMTLHPITSPVCGWVLPNHLDASLFFYNQAGEALGFIDSNVRWYAAPGSPSAIYETDNIKNPHLKRVVSYLLKRDADFFATYLVSIDSALDNIDPENYSSVSSLSVYVGRPVAIVRASLNAELIGHSAVNQNWYVFQQDFSRNYRSTDDFDKVKLSVRIGEYKQLNDGTVGYWIEEGDEFKDNVFYTPESDVDDAGLIKGHTHSDFNIQLGAYTENTYLTLLVDPRGKLHATSGLLPVKELEIPSVHYAEALRQMEVSFLTAPLLTTSLNTTVSLSAQAGYNWSWVEKIRSDWHETESLGTPRVEAVFEGSQHLVEGWLKLKPKNPDTNQQENNETNGPEPLGIEF